MAKERVLKWKKNGKKTQLNPCNENPEFDQPSVMFDSQPFLQKTNLEQTNKQHPKFYQELPRATKSSEKAATAQSTYSGEGNG